MSEVIVADGMVLSFMPSVISPFQTWKKGEATYVSNFFAVVHVNTGGTLHYRLERQRKLGIKDEEDVIRGPDGKYVSPTAFSNHIERACGLSRDFSVVLEIETPCSFDMLKRTIAGLARMSGGSLSLQPPSQHVMTWEEMADIVDATRYREAKEGPDIVCWVDEPQSKVKRDFYLARASHSTTNLEDFISRYQEDRCWSGKAQVEIGNLYQRRGQHENAVCAYDRAIKQYGTNTVPDTAPSSTVSELAIAARARCLKIMGLIPKANSNLNEIQNRHIVD